MKKIGGLLIKSPDEIKSKFNILIYGAPGVGKTYMAGSASEVLEMQPVLFLDIEGGSLSLSQYSDIDVIRVSKWNELKRVIRDLKKDTHYRTIVVDSLSELQSINMENIITNDIAIKAKEGKSRDDIPIIRDWMVSTDQMLKMVRDFRDLPHNIIFTSLPRIDQEENSAVQYIKPLFSAKLSVLIPATIDFTVYLTSKRSGKGIKRIAICEGSNTLFAKGRGSFLPPQIENPSMRKIYDYIFKDK